MEVLYAVTHDNAVTRAYNREQIASMCIEGRDADAKTIAITIGNKTETLMVSEYAFFASSITREMTPEEVMAYYIKGNLWDAPAMPGPSIADMLMGITRSNPNLSKEESAPKKDMPKIKYRCPKCGEMCDCAILGRGGPYNADTFSEWKQTCPNCGTEMASPKDNVCPVGYDIGKDCDKTPKCSACSDPMWAICNFKHIEMMHGH